MKMFTKIVLTLFFIPAFLLFVISATLRFQLLNPNFWQNTFNTNGTYLELSSVIKVNLENQVVAGGGKKSDVKILTDLVTPGNLKDFIDNNIDNFLGFINGQKTDLIVYIPINKISTSLLPMGFGTIKEQMKLQDLLKEFNIEGISASQIQQMRSIGLMVNIILSLSIVLSASILFALFKLTGNGKKIVSVGLAIVLGGFITLVGAGAIEFLKNTIIFDLREKQNLVANIMGAIIPPVLHEILKLWTVEVIIMVAAGTLLFFVKKPYNKSK